MISAPIWLITTAITASVQARAPLLRYPDDGWDKLAIWARFPQGTPPGVYAGDLVQQRRPPAPPAVPPAAGSGAGSGSAAPTPDP